MRFTKTIGSSVGADVSRPSPMYRPLMDTLNSIALHLLREIPHRRGESGGGWSGGPLWSPAVPQRDEDPLQCVPTVLVVRLV
jgi:hypothetical protein